MFTTADKSIRMKPRDRFNAMNPSSISFLPWGTYDSPPDKPLLTKKGERFALHLLCFDTKRFCECMENKEQWVQRYEDDMYHMSRMRQKHDAFDEFDPDVTLPPGHNFRQKTSSSLAIELTKNEFLDCAFVDNKIPNVDCLLFLQHEVWNDGEYIKSKMPFYRFDHLKSLCDSLHRIFSLQFSYKYGDSLQQLFLKHLFLDTYLEKNKLFPKAFSQWWDCPEFGKKVFTLP